MQIAASRGIEVKDAELELRFPNGSSMQILGGASPLFNADSTVRGSVATFVDITEQKRAQDQLLKAKEAADAGNRAKDEFLAVVSHELRTPLTAMLGWIRMLGSAKLSPAQAQRGIEVLERNIRIQTQLVEDLLDVSRIISGKMPLNRRQIDLQDVINASLQSVAPTLDAKRISVRTSLTSIKTIGDPDRLQQVFWNLLSNAIKFTPQNGTIEVSLQMIDSTAELRVRDSGIGIRENVIPFLFEAFRQADSSTTRNFGGLGLGLTIVRHLVELHGGSVKAESEGEGKGATFSVRLPIPVFASADTQAFEELEGNSELKNLRILAVDDEPDARELIKMILELSGAMVATASNAREALEQLMKDPPDVLICDIGMPNKDGYTLIREVRAFSEIPAMAVTAYSKAEDRQRAFDAGFDRYLAKPIEPVELVREVSLCRRVV
jgi:signal transduction histidine kinase